MAELTKNGERAWVRLILAARTALGQVEAALKEAGLPQLVWYDVLLELSRAGEDRLRHKDLVNRMLLEKYNLTRLIDRMAASGVVERVRDDADARGAAIRITEKGVTLKDAMWPVYRDAVAASFSGRYSGDELSTLARLLGRVR